MARNAVEKCRNSNVFTFGLICLGLSLTIHLTQGKQSRVRRQACEEYTFDGRTCCKCGSGFKLEEPCTAQKNDTKCQPCEDNSYNSLPNFLKSCEPCKSCSQPKANLTVDTPCTRTKDTVCKCKDNHYCVDDTRPCTSCSPCTVCDPDVGVKTSCSLISDTICNETNKHQVGSTVGITLGIIIPFIVCIAVGVFLWRRRRRTGSRSLNSTHTGNGVAHSEMEMTPLNAVNEDLMPHIPALAEVITWTDMRNIALGSNMSGAVIDSIETDYRQDSQERTIRLLMKWTEKEGREASRKLIQSLNNSGKKGKAERVMEILSVANSQHDAATC